MDERRFRRHGGGRSNGRFKGRGRGRGGNSNKNHSYLNMDGALKTSRFPTPRQSTTNRLPCMTICFSFSFDMLIYLLYLFVANIRFRPDDESVPEAVEIATELLTRIADYSSFTTGEEKELLRNIMEIARPLVELGKYSKSV